VSLKAALVVFDGASDRPLKELKGKTPLEVASTPNLDRAAGMGVNGIVDILAPGVPPGSDVAHLALFGYDALKVYRGRGALEALGAGFKVRQGDVAFRGNLATLQEGLVTDRRAGRIDTATAAEIVKSLGKLSSKKHPEVKVFLLHTTEHRLAVVLRGPGLSPHISDTDPGKTGQPLLKAEPLTGEAEAQKTAEVVNEVTGEILRRLRNQPLNRGRIRRGLPPANAVILRGAGVLPEIEPFTERFGVKAAFIAVTSLIRGVCLAVGMKPITVKGATGTTETNLLGKAKALVRALETHDFCFLHVKGADNASHDGNIEKKIAMIERLDEMTGYLLEKLNLEEEVYLAITVDHTTPITVRNHTGDPVPLTILGPEVLSDEVKAFSERSCARGGLGRIRGEDVVNILMNYLGKIKKLGA
jgi:2,3-bisphosphoglycerate-independent phosphoglycerate mutase